MNAATRKQPRSKEAPVLKGCLSTLKLHGFPAWRINSGMLANPAGRPVRFGAVGFADIVALGRDGRAIFIEVKRPGGKPTEAQVSFLDSARRRGAVAVVIDDIAVLHRMLVRLQAKPLANFDIGGTPC